MSSPTANIGFQLHDVARLMRKRFEQRTARVGFTRAQWQALVYLARNEGIHQAGLAELLDVEPISLMRILDKLQARGLVERRQHPRDRRVWLLYLTPEAHPSLDILRSLGEQTRAEALAGISDDDREKLMSVLDALHANLITACTTAVVDDEVHHG